MSHPAVTVCIPSIPRRAHLLQRAIRSVERQTHPNVGIEVEVDTERTGAAATRNLALERVETEYVAFLDDDDEFWPRHLELCLSELVSSGADLVYPWFEIIGSLTGDPLGWFGRIFDPDAIRNANYVPVTVVARTESVRAAGGFVNLRDDGATCEDWMCWIAMLDNGARFVHLPRITWTWNHHGGNTSGNARNW